MPRAVWVLLAAAAVAHLLALGAQDAGRSRIADLPPPPRPAALRMASLDEREAAARVALLYLQSFDLRGTNRIVARELDYGRVADWLQTALVLDPRGQYPLFLAARVYAEIADPVRMRGMLDFVHRHFAADPDRRWPALAHAALLAKHRLRDLPLARRYAGDLQRLTSSPDVPLWAKQMEIFILEDMNELEAARIMLGGLLASGTVRDPGEARYLKHRLDELESRIRSADRN